jgi:hypothetical protein
MLGIVVLRGVELVVPLDRACESPGEGVSVGFLGGGSCVTAPPVAEGGAPWGPPLDDGMARCPFGGWSVRMASRFSGPADAYGCGRNPGAEWCGGAG